MSTINSRIKELIDNIGITPYEFSKKMGDKRPDALYNLIKDNGTQPSPKTISKIIDNFSEVNYSWLLTGDGEMFTDGSKPPIKKAEYYKIENKTGYYYPDVYAAAGLDTELKNDELNKIPVDIPGWEKGITFINVFGDSMYPKYNAGEIIGVKPIEFQYLNYGYSYVVVFNNGDVYIKIVQPGSDKEHLILESINEFYKPKEFHLEQIKSFYSIKGVIKKEMM